MHFHIVTLGCKTNQYESQAIAESLAEKGFVHTLDPCRAETIILNSCAVTSRAVRDLKKTSRQLSRKNPDARIIITGCAAQILEQELSLMEEVHLVIPQSEKKLLLNGLGPFRNSPDSGDYSISNYSRSRAVVKVQDGCDHRCTFCIVPYTRGKPVSRSPWSILDEISRLQDNGVSEIILSGINLRLYGKDFSKAMDFWDLILFLQSRLIRTDKNIRLRLSSLDPSQLNARALDALSGQNLVCPHLHLSLQSGSEEILTTMNRSHYSPDQLAVFLNKLAKVWPVFSLGADILTGFPGETSSHHEKTMHMAQNLPLTYAHIFPYSPRPGTPAAGFSHQVNPGVKKQRTEELKSIIKPKKKAFLQRLLQLEKLSLIMETDSRAMSEYYVECLIEDVTLRPRQTIEAVPLKTSRDKIIVKPLISGKRP